MSVYIEHTQRYVTSTVRRYGSLDEAVAEVARALRCSVPAISAQLQTTAGVVAGWDTWRLVTAETFRERAAYASAMCERLAAGADVDDLQ
jgi:hypothetical protein